MRPAGEGGRITRARRARARAVALRALAATLAIAAPGAVAAQAAQAVHRAPAPRIGPARGALVLVGGGGQGVEVYARFLELAGGPDAPIVVIPTASIADSAATDWHGARGLRWSGARRVSVLHAVTRAAADDDSLVAMLDAARGVWFDGGRQGRLVDRYAGTRVEAALHALLARGGVVGGTSAGASIAGSFLVRGAPGLGGGIVFPGYTTGFGFLRETAIDQHVTARRRLRDLHDSVLSVGPALLGIALDEGTAAVVRGDTLEVIGRGSVFVTGARVSVDHGRPFQQLRAGDRLDLSRRTVLARAGHRPDDTAAAALLRRFVRTPDARTAALLLVDRTVHFAATVGVAPDPSLVPATSSFRTPLGRLSAVVLGPALERAVCERIVAPADTLADSGEPIVSLRTRAEISMGDLASIAGVVHHRHRGGFAAYLQIRILRPLGMHGVHVAGRTGEIDASVDDLARLMRALDDWRETSAVPFIATPQPCDDLSPVGAMGWSRLRIDGHAFHRMAERTTSTSHLLLRDPARRIALIVLSSDPALDVDGLTRALLRSVPAARPRSG